MDARRGVIALLDIDGTLILGRNVAHGQGLVLALADVYGVTAGEAELLAVAPAGRTDLEIALALLGAAGVPEADAHAGLQDWCARAVERYLDVHDGHPPPRAAPGAAEALGMLRDAGVGAALVTGNIAAIAHHKVGAAGLGGWFRAGEGGYGSDAVARADVVRIAMRRAGLPPRDGIVVGDTPRDIAAARAAGCGVVAVTTGGHRADALQGADAVAANLIEAARHVIRPEPR